MDVTIDLSRDPVAEDYYVKDNRALRRLVVFQPDDGVDLEAPLVRQFLAQSAKDLWQSKKQEAIPQEPLYELGTAIDFASEGNSKAYKRDGWVVAERRHTWTSGAESALVLLIDGSQKQPPIKSGYRLSVDLRPFVVPGLLDAQSLTVTINGHDVFDGSIRAQTTVEAKIPEAIIDPGRPVHIKFSHPKCARPADLLPQSRDRKLLAFALMRLSLSAVE